MSGLDDLLGPGPHQEPGWLESFGWIGAGVLGLLVLAWVFVFVATGVGVVGAVVVVFGRAAGRLVLSRRVSG